MMSGRPLAPGKTRSCPHCKATILASATVCPACNHHLQFTPGTSTRAMPSFTPFKVEGTIRHRPEEEPWEYSILVTIRNDRGEEVARHVVGVGALQGTEQRTFSLNVEVFAPRAPGSVSAAPPAAANLPSADKPLSTNTASNSRPPGGNNPLKK